MCRGGGGGGGAPCILGDNSKSNNREATEEILTRAISLPQFTFKFCFVLFLQLFHYIVSNAPTSMLASISTMFGF